MCNMEYQMETISQNELMLKLIHFQITNAYLFGVIEKITLFNILNRFRLILAKTVNENETDFKVLYVC